jgi:tRNA(Ile2) C34 agmatinyltransferase TiaS
MATGGYSGFKPYSPEALRPRCPICGAMMRTAGTQFYCTSDECKVEFVKIVTKADWVEKRLRDEARRKAQLEEAIKRGENYPPAIQI